MKINIVLLLLSVLLCSAALGQKTKQQKDSLKAIKKSEKKYLFKDSTDNAFDVSNFLRTKTGFMPVPMIITEPAIGYGGGLTGVFFYDKLEDSTGKVQVRSTLPPSFTAVTAFGTQNKTWGAFAAHRGVMFKDRFRFIVGSGFINLNIDIYSFDAAPDLGIGINLQAVPLIFQGVGRIGKSPIFLGGNYLFTYGNLKIPDNPGGIVGELLKKFENEYYTSGLGLIAILDTRDNTITATKGFFVKHTNTLNFTWLGSDNDFYNFTTQVMFYQPLFNDKFFLGYNFTMGNSIGDAPVYMQPFVKLRGVPSMRYQAKNMIYLDSEYRYQFYKRWSLLGFVGFGFAEDKFSDMSFNNQYALSGGGGFRYLISKYFGMHAGMDFAGSSEGFAFYFTVGSYWGGI